MNAFHGCLAAFFCIALVQGTKSQSSPRYKDHKRPMVVLDGQGREQPVRNRDDWARRREHILDGLQDAIGRLPNPRPSPPFDVQILEEKTAENFIRYKLTFVAEQDDRVPAYLFVPRKADRAKSPAILALHQTTAIGKGEPAGVGGLSSLHYGLELAQRGYVVLCPDYPSFGDYKYDFKKSPYPSGVLKSVVNNMRAVDLLASRPDVDADHIGAIGHSLGGHTAIALAVFDPRVKVVVSSCGWTPMHDYYGGKIAGWTSDRYVPRIRDVYNLNPDLVPFDYYELIAALAPRRFYSSSPLHDSNFNVRGVRKVEAAVKPVFALLGAPDALAIRYPNCGHEFPEQIRAEAYAFIDAALKGSAPASGR
jgi:hypothetical protein